MIVGFIGDIHGKNIWKNIIKNNPDVNHWVFMGDYSDNDFGSVISDDEMIENLQNIVDFKKNDVFNVTLLIGNHDNNYIHVNDLTKRSTRIRGTIALELYDIYHFNQNLFQNAWQMGNVIATHAGIQHNWFKNEFKGCLDINIVEQLNKPKNKEQEERLFDIGIMRGGNQNVGGIYWCDREELKKPLKGYIQIVGHNRVTDMKHMTFYKKPMQSEIYFIDCLNYKENFLKLELTNDTIQRI